MDRLNQHTLQCKACSAALKWVQRLQVSHCYQGAGVGGGAGCDGGQAEPAPTAVQGVQCGFEVGAAAAGERWAVALTVIAQPVLLQVFTQARAAGIASKVGWICLLGSVGNIDQLGQFMLVLLMLSRRLPRLLQQALLQQSLCLSSQQQQQQQHKLDQQQQQQRHLSELG